MLPQYDVMTKLVLKSQNLVHTGLIKGLIAIYAL